jgi:acyl carrier protein
VLADEIFAPVLQTDGFGTADNFFELGGNSLRAAQLLFQIKQRFGVTVGIGDFFRSPTVAHVAAMVDQQRMESLDDAGLLELIEQMPDADAARLLGEQRDQP